jgi:hypothetical protein
MLFQEFEYIFLMPCRVSEFNSHLEFSGHALQKIRETRMIDGRRRRQLDQEHPAAPSEPREAAGDARQPRLWTEELPRVCQRPRGLDAEYKVRWQSPPPILERPVGGPPVVARIQLHSAEVR